MMSMCLNLSCVMLKAGWGSIIYFLLALSILGSCSSSHPLARALSNSPSEENETSSPSTEEINYEQLLRPVFDGDAPVEDLPPELQKRIRNYLRFGRDEGAPMAYAVHNDIDLTEEEKRAARNFLRFGRGPEKNFLRFGRAGPMEFGLGLAEDDSEGKEDVKRGTPRNFLRFGRGNLRNFIRFGRASGRNFIRFGRSVDRQMKEECDDCAEDSINTLPSTSYHLSTALSKSSDRYLEKDNGDSLLHNKVSRVKRSVPGFYDDVLFMAPTPVSWVENLSRFGSNTGSDERIPTTADEYTPNGQKRAHSRSFLRYGRDPLELHFLRFGKRATLDDKTIYDHNEEEKLARISRGRAVKNFLRFG